MKARIQFRYRVKTERGKKTLISATPAILTVDNEAGAIINEKVFTVAGAYNQSALRVLRCHVEDLVRHVSPGMEGNQDAAISGMALLSKYQNTETNGHAQRTKHYVRSLAEALSVEYPDELTPANIELLYQSASLHDIGKAAIHDSVLKKCGRFTLEEFAAVKLHTLIGSEIIRQAEAFLGANTYLRLAREMAEIHHERWDGSGYPHRLKGYAIPLSARLMAIADIYDALISRRSYKSPYSHGRAFDVIINGDERTRPEHFSPVVLEAFRSVHPEWIQIADSFSDQSLQGIVTAGTP
jgi:putative two-component system response regulator